MKHLLLPSSVFLQSARSYLKRHPDAYSELEAVLKCLVTDPFDPALRTCKLDGALDGSISAFGGYEMRVVFTLTQHEGQSAISLESVCGHDAVHSVHVLP